MFGLIPRKESVRAELPLANLRSDFRALYDRLLPAWPTLFELSPERDRIWSLELKETEKELIVRAELPGFEPEEVDLRLRGDELMLRAEKKIESRETDKDTKVIERRRYERIMTLPVEIDPEKVEATYHNGVLEVRLPRTEAARVKHVPVKGT